MAKMGGLVEFEEMGQVALFGLLLIPGAWWIARAKTGPRMAVRSALVLGFLAGAAVLEGTLDGAANKVAGEE